MRSEYIFQKAEGALGRHDTRDPFAIARESGVRVYFREDFKRLKGMYSVIHGNRCIFINGNLPGHVRRIVCAHELGHDELHRELTPDTVFQEYTLYDMKNRSEYDANVYAAHLLLDRDEVLRLARGGYDAFQIAAEMGTDINLLLIKINEMGRQGYELDLPYIPRGDFLKEG